METMRNYRLRSDTIKYIKRVSEQLEAGVIEAFGKGGDQRPESVRTVWDKYLVRFSVKVDELLPLWKHIKEFCEPSDINWNESFRNHSCEDVCDSYSKTPEALPDELLLRANDKKLTKRDREPLALACLHAAHLLGITRAYIALGKRPPKIETLRRRYHESKRLRAR